jgi:very-short-patch-repair endonuclease
MYNKVIDRRMFYGAKAATFATAETLRRHMTVAEAILWNKLKDRKRFKVKFRRQHPIDFFIVDFYCHSLKLVIEIDGEMHETQVQKDHDRARAWHLEQFGIRIVRFSNDEILNDLNSVLEKVLHLCTDEHPL